MILVVVDITPPLSGWVHDGPDRDEDIMYSSRPASLNTHWGDFKDPESDIAKYTVTVTQNHKDVLVAERKKEHTQMEDHTLHFKHGDEVKVKVESTNGATL